jgi:hypothetical protein
MPTREQVSRSIQDALAAGGLAPTDSKYAFVLHAMEDMNHGVADLDDELAASAEQLAWLARAPTWTNQRPAAEFATFVETKLAECEAALVHLRKRWEEHQRQSPAGTQASTP